MQQYTFRATDRLGNTIQGAIEADSLDAAAERVRTMGYSPQELKETSPAGFDLTAPVLPLSAPDVLTSLPPAAPDVSDIRMELQPVPVERDTTPVPFAAAAGSIPRAVPLNPDAGFAVGQVSDRLEPWQRGGPIAGLYEATATVGAMATGVSTVPHLGGTVSRQTGIAIPYTASRRPQESYIERFKGAFVYPIVSGVPLKELAPFYRQFATMISAGIPLHKVLVSLQASTENRRLREIVARAEQQVLAGGMLSDAFAAFPWVFPDLHIELIRVGEQGGMFEQVLYQIADYVDHDVEIRRLVSRETFYPKIVLFVALMVLGRGFPANMAIVDLVVHSDVAGYFWNTIGFGGTILLVGFAITAFCRLVLFNIPGVAEMYDRIKMSIPGLGGLVKMFSMAKFARTFAALYRAGIGMTSALRTAGNASGNAVVEAAAHRAIVSVESGRLASDALKQSGVFTPMALDMMRTGETSGSLDVMMDKLADYNENEAKMKAHQVAMTFTTLVFLIVAIMVGIAIVSFYVGAAEQTLKAGAE